MRGHNFPVFEDSTAQRQVKPNQIRVWYIWAPRGATMKPPNQDQHGQMSLACIKLMFFFCFFFKAKTEEEAAVVL